MWSLLLYGKVYLEYSLKLIFVLHSMTVWYDMRVLFLFAFINGTIRFSFPPLTSVTSSKQFLLKLFSITFINTMH